MDAKAKSTVQKIAEALQQPDTILFIGSGVSAWSGLPSWGALLTKIADAIDEAGLDSIPVRRETVNPLHAASLAMQILGKNRIYTILVDALHNDETKPHKVHRLIKDLGPTCYITTNYDTLLEQTLQSEQNGYIVATNQDPALCANIKRANQTKFIFKPHGDINDSASIVITNEDYEDMYENGKKISAFRTLEIFLSTRTVVFLGYSLADSDFKRLIGKISKTYNGHLCESYAIIPDATEVDIEYWKKYNLHILPYEVVQTPKGNDYKAFIKLLETLAFYVKGMEATNKPSVTARFTAAHKKALARYATAMTLEYTQDDATIYPLNVELEHQYRHYQSEMSVSDFIQMEPQNYVIASAPGGGKSFLLRQYCYHLAQNLLDWCEGRAPRGTKPLIPILVDLKFYDKRGYLKEQIENQLPPNLPIEQWQEQGRFVYLLDAYNEMQQKFIDNKFCFYEIQHLTWRNKVIITTRIPEQVKDLSLFRCVKLQSIDAEYICRYLHTEAGLPALAEQEKVVYILQKPLFFKLLVQDKLERTQLATPRLIYQGYIQYLQGCIDAQFDLKIDLFKIFGHLCHELIESENEYFSHDTLFALFAVQGLTDKPLYISLVNWLVEVQQLFAPAPGNQLAFFHQSVTEFMAARQLVQSYQQDNDIIYTYLANTRWDYVLLYAAEFFTPDQAQVYINTILKNDILLALRACQYLEVGSEHTISIVLQYIVDNLLERQPFETLIDAVEELGKLPVAPVHLPYIYRLIEQKDLIGHAGVQCLVNLCGNTVKAELIDLLFNNFDDHNFSNGIGTAISNYINENDINDILNRLQQLEQGENEPEFLAGLVNAFGAYSLDELFSFFYPLEKLHGLKLKLLSDLLQESHTQESMAVCFRLLSYGHYEAVFPLFLTLNYHSEGLDYLIIPEDIFDTVIDFIYEYPEDKYLIQLFYCIYQSSKPFAKAVREYVKYTTGLSHLVCLYAINKNRTPTFLSEYNHLLYEKQMPPNLIGAFSGVDWLKDAHSLDYTFTLLLKNYTLNDLANFIECITHPHLYTPTPDFLASLFDKITTTEYTDADGKPDIGEFLAVCIHNDALLQLYRAVNPQLQFFFRHYVLCHISDCTMDFFASHELEEMFAELHMYDLDNDLLVLNEVLLIKMGTDELFQKYLPSLQQGGETARANYTYLMQKYQQEYGRRLTGKNM